MEREIFGVVIADELADVRPERSRCGCTSGDSNSWDWISGNSPVRPDNVSYGGDRDRGEGRGLESAAQLVLAVSTPPKGDRVMLVGRKENLSRIRERNKRKKSGRRIKRGWQIEKTVEVEVIERLRREGTSLKSIVSANCYWQSYIPLSAFPPIQLSLHAKYFLPARPLSKSIPQYRQLRCRWLSGRRRRRGVRTRPRRCRDCGHSILCECKASANMFFQPGNYFYSVVSGIAPRECDQLVQPRSEVYIYNGDLFPCAQK